MEATMDPSQQRAKRPRVGPVTFRPGPQLFEFRMTLPGGGASKFQTSVRAAGGDAEAAGRIAALCYERHLSGASRAELAAYRSELYRVSRDGGGLPADGGTAVLGPVPRSSTDVGMVPHAPVQETSPGESCGRAVPTCGPAVPTAAEIWEQDLRLIAKYVSNIVCRSRDESIREEALSLLTMPAPAATPLLQSGLAASSCEEETVIREGVLALLLQRCAAPAGAAAAVASASCSLAAVPRVVAGVADEDEEDDGMDDDIDELVSLLPGVDGW